MHSWYSKNLGDGILAQEPLRHIEQRFLSAYTDAGTPEDMALFIRHDSEGRLHCEVWI